MNKRIFFVLILVVNLLLSACGNNDSQTAQQEVTEIQDKKIIYTNDKWGITVFEAEGWVQSTSNYDQTFSDSLNLIYQNETLKAIITIVSNNKSLEDIKKEIMISLGNVDVLEDSNTFLTLKTNRKESIRIDIYFNRNELHTGIITFMVPLDKYEANKNKISDFRDNVEF